MAQPARLKARVSSLVDHAPGVRSLWLELERPAPKFKPGQFLHLALDPFDPSSHWPESRCFSIASSPTERQTLRLVVSAKGVFTQRIMELKPGAQVWVKLPFGDFVVEEPTGRPVVLVAGGTGVSPYLPLLASDTPPKNAVHLLFGAREPALLIGKDVIDDAIGRWPNLRATFFAERGATVGMEAGRLSTDVVLKNAHVAAGRADSVFYLSGPPSMLTTLRTGLQAAGIEPHRIRIDAWD